LPADFEEFSSTYLDTNGNFTKAGQKSYQDDIAGYVSYLNRSQDARSFSYPVFHNVNVSLPVFVKGEKNQNDLAMKQLKADLKVAKGNAKLEIDGLKYETRIKVEEAKEAVKNYKFEIASAKEEKRNETKRCMELDVKSRPLCKQQALQHLEKALALIEMKSSKMQVTNVADLKKQYADQINGVKNAIADTTQFEELKELKDMMDGFKLTLKESRQVLKEKKDVLKDKRAAFKKMNDAFKNKMESVKGKANEKELRKEIRNDMGSNVKAGKKDLDAIKTDVYNMKQDMHIIRLKMKRSVISDFSPATMFIKKCFKKQ
jgi:hypothetical protein